MPRAHIHNLTHVPGASILNRKKPSSKLCKPVKQAVPDLEVEARPDGASVPSPPERFGFMAGELKIPNDFDRMGSEEIRQMFEGIADSNPRTGTNVGG